MKYLLFVLFISFSVVINAQQSNFDNVVIKKSGDKSLKKSLLQFKKGGIEKEMVIDTALIDSFIFEAKSFVGTKHCMGGMSHKCIDCSGLLVVSFKKIGVNVPHSSEAISRYGEIISNQDSLRMGDLVFFIRTYKTSKFITHAGIFLGDKKFVHTSASRGVTVSDLSNSYYQEHFIFGTRIFK